ncbi:MAG: hypothetical protein IJW46_01325 [Clostridia bacterium]|nr:hypothetical protein [Clostridia bacterium]
MKRTLAVILVISMLACLLPAFTFATTAADNPEPQSGLYANFYALPGINNHDGAYKGIIGTNSGDYEYCGYDDTQLYDATIEQLLKISANGNSTVGENLNAFPPVNAEGNLVVPNLDGYMIQWKGTVTAATSGTYTFAARELDNGFVAFVKQGDEMKKVFEYWAAFHWFDGLGENHYLKSNLGGFTLEAGVPTEVELWYLETGGGQALTVGVGGDTLDSFQSFADAGLTFSVEGTCWRTNIYADNDSAHNAIRDVMAAGVNKDGGVAENANGCSAGADGNHTYDASYAAIKEKMVLIGSTVTPNFETDSIKVAHKYGAYGWGDLDDMIAEFTGYITVTEGNGGVYQFGTRNVDNCLMVEIEIDGTWTRVYEFWAKNIWNDESDTYYQVGGNDVTVTLEEGKTYGVRAVFLEINGGNPIETIVKVDGTRAKLVEKVVFTTEKPTAPVKPTIINLFDNTKEWYYKTSGNGNEFQIRDDAWKTDPAVYGTWDKAANPGSHWGTADDPANNQSLWAVTTFDIEKLSDIEGYELMMKISYDDNIRMYVNGKLVNIELGWNEGGAATWSLTEEATDLLVEGTNTIAMKLVQGWGGSSVNVESVYLSLEDNGNNPYEYKYFDAQGNKVSGIISTADEWLAYAAIVNEKGGEGTRDDRILIAADLDFEGKEWIPMNVYIGRIFGEYHTFKNITYTATVDATGKGEGANVGLLTNSLANQNANGHVENLTFENCKLTVNATEGAGNEFAIAGIVAGMVDRGRIENVTVKNSSIDGNAAAAGAIAGVACWSYDNNGVHVENCAVIDTTVKATKVAGGAVAYARGGDTVRIGNVYVENVTLDAPKSGFAYGDVWGWGENVKLYSTTLAGKNAIGSTLKADPEADYTFYYQMRESGEGTYDYRIICVANKAWAIANESIKVQISFYAGASEKSTTQIADTVYEKVTATSGNLTEIYTSDADSVIFGWVVENVPADYVEESPSAIIVE